MARIAVLSTPSLADGFRLAGVATTIARPGDEALAALRSLLEETDVGLVLVTADLWASLGERTRESVERLARPIVLAVPAGAPSEVTTRRELVADMLRRAIGYRIQIGAGRA
jgi:vacuolar-type H+-ATPase subunit F/Vma7